MRVPPVTLRAQIYKSKTVPRGRYNDKRDVLLSDSGYVVGVPYVPTVRVPSEPPKPQLTPEDVLKQYNVTLKDIGDIIKW